MSKKVYLGLAVVALAVVLAGCGIQNSNQQQQTIKEPIKIGVSLPLTGASAFIGNSYLDGLKMAQSEINKAGGVNGRQVDLVLEDNQNLAKEGISSLNALMLKNPDLILTTMSVPSVAVSPLVKESGKPLFVSVVFADIISKNDNAVSFFPRTIDDAKATVPAMVKNKVKTVGVIYLKSEYGQASYDGFKAEAEKAGIKIVAVESFLGDTTDYATPLLKLKQKNPEAIYVIAINAIPVVKNIKSNNIKAAIYNNLIPVYGSLVYKDPTTFEGTYLTAPKVAIVGTPEYDAFRAKATANGIKLENNSLGYTSVGYDNLQSIAKVFGKDSDPKDFVSNFSKLGQMDGVNGRYDLTGRDVGMPVYPVKMEKGKLVEIK